MKEIVIKPTGNYVLLQLFAKKDSTMVLPDDIMNPFDDVRILAVGPQVQCCAVDDKVLLRPNTNLLGIDDAKKIALVDAGAILAVLE